VNFYLADESGHYDPTADNAYVPDFFVNLFYESRHELGFSLDVLFDIDPYEVVKVDDVSTLKEEVEHLMSMPNHIAFARYPYVAEHIEKLNEYLKVAIKEGKTIISEGD